MIIVCFLVIIPEDGLTEQPTQVNPETERIGRYYIDSGRK